MRNVDPKHGLLAGKAAVILRAKAVYHAGESSPPLTKNLFSTLRTTGAEAIIVATETINKTRPLSFDIEITNVSKNDTDERRVVAGYGSLDVIDRQGERITPDAMRKALEKFMANPEFANTHVMHGNVAVGKVIPVYTDMNGERWKTEVTENGTFIVSELRTDIERANQVWELIKDGRLKSYSVGGLSISPKELVCQETGTCHWEINELEIHEFSYVDRPAVKGADFIIVKSDGDLNLKLQNMDPRPKAMHCPLEKSETGGQTYKPESPKSDVIIMTDSQAEVSEVTEETEQAVSDEPEQVVEETVDEAEKADATPTLLEIKAQNEVILNLLEQFIKPPEASEPQKFDYPEEQVAVLQAKYGDENTLSLLTILGDDYSKLLDKAEEEPVSDPEPVIEAETVEEEKTEKVTAPQEDKPVVEATEAEPISEPEAEESKAETEDPPAEVEETAEPEIDKSQIIEDIQVAMDETVSAKLTEFEETIAKYAKINKRSPGPKAEVKGKSLLDTVAKMGWRSVDELALRGA